MNKGVKINHVAIQSTDKDQALIFFSKILGFSIVKSFTISKELSSDIFGINKSVDVDVYDNGQARIEVFITDIDNKNIFEHVCIEVPDKKQFINRCNENGLNPYIVRKGEKDLLFVRDFSKNLYEIKGQVNK